VQINNEAEGFIVINPEVAQIYKAAQALPSRDQAVLLLTLMQSQQGNPVNLGNSAAQAKTIYQINSMTPAEMALVLDAIASTLRSGGANAKQDNT
jgi:hypothetical protein